MLDHNKIIDAIIDVVCLEEDDSKTIISRPTRGVGKGVFISGNIAITSSKLIRLDSTYSGIANPNKKGSSFVTKPTAVQTYGELAILTFRLETQNYLRFSSGHQYEEYAYVSVGDSDNKTLVPYPTSSEIDEGSPILNSRGEITGLWVDSARISVEKILALIQIIHRKTNIVEIGAELNDFTSFYSAVYSSGLTPNEGVIVASVQENGPFDLAGIKPGCVLLEADGEKVTSEWVPSKETISCRFYGDTIVSVRLA